MPTTKTEVKQIEQDKNIELISKDVGYMRASLELLSRRLDEMLTKMEISEKSYTSIQTTLQIYTDRQADVKAKIDSIEKQVDGVQRDFYTMRDKMAGSFATFRWVAFGLGAIQALFTVITVILNLAQR